MRWSNHGFCKNGHELAKVGTCSKGYCALCRSIKKKECQNLKFYGIKSLEERDAILAAQGNACAACGRTDCTWGRGWLNVWHIDHKHGEMGTHRGILCGRCNILVGILETAREVLGKCEVYLQRWAG